MATNRKNEPSEKQLGVLRNYGLDIAPRTKIACSRLIDFIRHGNGAGGDTVFDRVAITKSFWQEWTGRTVEHNGAVGTVLCPVARRVEEVYVIRKRIPRDAPVSPFQLQVKWSSGFLKGRTTILSVSTIGLGSPGEFPSQEQPATHL